MTVRVVPFFSAITPVQVKEQMFSAIRATGVDVFNPESVFDEGAKKNGADTHPSLTYLLIGTGGTEQLVAEYVEKTHIAPPIHLLAHKGNNSLPAAMEIRAYLESQNTNSVIIHDEFESLCKRMDEWVEFDGILQKLRNSRIGVIGSVSKWLIASNIDASDVKRNWGITIEQIPFETLTDQMEAQDVSALAQELTDAADLVAVPYSEVERAAQVAGKMQQIAADSELDAVTLECFRLVGTTQVTGCYALALLNARGLVAGCEGDLPTTFTMYLSRLLTGSSSFMANVISVDQDRGTVDLAHCTVPLDLVLSYDIMSHYETDKSVGIRGRMEEGPVTLVKVHGPGLERYWVSSGRLIGNLSEDDACRTQIRVKLDGSVDYFLNASLANHHVIIPGDHEQRFRRFFGFSAGAT